MSATKTKVMKKAMHGERRTLAEAKANEAAAEESAKHVAASLERERNRLMAELDKHTLETAPSMEAATSDVLAVLQVAGLEFVRRYYPDATHASFTVSVPNPDRTLGDSVRLPIPVKSTAPDERREDAACGSATKAALRCGDPVIDAAVRWWVEAYLLAERMQDTAEDLAHEMETNPDSPLHKAFSADCVRAIASDLSGTTCTFANANPHRIAPLPDPLAGIKS